MSDKVQQITKDCEVEVSSEEEGFRGAWYRAILLNNPTKSGRVKLRIRYMTLLEDDGSSPLTEVVDQGHIRPVPPDYLYNDVAFEEGLVVDSDHKDGWWTGVIISQIEDENNFLVYFDSPPDIIQFERKQLRPHFLWTGWKWVRPEIKELDRSMFSAGTMVEVSSTSHKMAVAWFPAMMIKEIEVGDEKKFVLKDCNKHLSCNGDEARPNSIVDTRRVRPTPPPFSCETYKLLDSVEAFRGGLGWRRGKVRGVLSDNCYMICLEATKEESVFKHSDLRPFKVWEDGVWHDGPKQKPAKESPSNVVKKKPMRSSPGAKLMTPKRVTKHVRRSLNPEEKGETLTKAYTLDATGELRTKKVDAVMNDKAHPVMTPQVTSIAKESISPVTPSPVITGTTLRQTETETEGKKSLEKTLEPVKNQNGLGSGSTRQKIPDEENSKDTSRKRKREEKHNSGLKETDGTCTGSKAEINGTNKNLSIDYDDDDDDDDDDRPLSAWIGNLSTELSSDQSLNVVYNAPNDVEETPAKDTLMVLPFAKKSPFWKKYETNEEYKTVPQSPHFSPLVEAKEDFREWSAVGMMVTFYGLLEEVKELQLDVSSSKLSSLSSSFAELEKHGFDVAMPQLRINKVVSLQDERAKKAEERKCLEKKIEAEDSQRHELEEEMAELERKLQELKEKKEAADKSVVEMKSYAETTDQEIEDLALEFHTTVLAPW